MKFNLDALVRDKSGGSGAGDTSTLDQKSNIMIQKSNMIKLEHSLAL